MISEFDPSMIPTEPIVSDPEDLGMIPCLKAFNEHKSRAFVKWIRNEVKSKLRFTSIFYFSTQGKKLYHEYFNLQLYVCNRCINCLFVTFPICIGILCFHKTKQIAAYIICCIISVDVFLLICLQAFRLPDCIYLQCVTHHRNRCKNLPKIHSGFR